MPLVTLPEFANPITLKDIFLAHVDTTYQPSYQLSLSNFYAGGSGWRREFSYDPKTGGYPSSGGRDIYFYPAVNGSPVQAPYVRSGTVGYKAGSQSATTIPTNGEISFGDFHGSTGNPRVSIAQSYSSVNATDYYLNNLSLYTNYTAGATRFFLTFGYQVNASIPPYRFYSIASSTSTAALTIDISDLTTGDSIDLNFLYGGIFGKGGNGGGGVGGPALRLVDNSSTYKSVSISVGAGFFIYGGGGGGGGPGAGGGAGGGNGANMGSLAGGAGATSLTPPTGGAAEGLFTNRTGANGQDSPTGGGGGGGGLGGPPSSTFGGGGGGGNLLANYGGSYALAGGSGGGGQGGGGGGWAASWYTNATLPTRYAGSVVSGSGGTGRSAGGSGSIQTFPYPPYYISVGGSAGGGGGGGGAAGGSSPGGGGGAGGAAITAIKCPYSMTSVSPESIYGSY